MDDQPEGLGMYGVQAGAVVLPHSFVNRLGDETRQVLANGCCSFEGHGLGKDDEMCLLGRHGRLGGREQMPSVLMPR